MSSASHVAGTFRNPNDFSCFLAILLALPFAVLFSRPRPLAAALSATSIAAGAAFMVLNDTRTALLAMLAAPVVGFVERLARSHRKLIRFLPFGVLAAGVFTVAALSGRLSPLLSDPAWVNEHPSVASRTHFLLAAFLSAGERGLLGLGAGGSEHLLRETRTVISLGFQNMHNFWLEVLCNYGIAWLAAVLAFFVTTFVTLSGESPSDPRAARVARFLRFSLAVLVLAAMGPSSIFPHSYVWVHLSIAAAAAREERG
jgi:teichuronic acid biosynthesis protein TuaE